MDEIQTSTPNHRSSQKGQEINEKKKKSSDAYSVCSDVSKVSRRSSRHRHQRRGAGDEEKSVSIKKPKEDEDAQLLPNNEDDSRHWPRETETFATSECTRISNEDLGKFHADLEARLNLKKWLDPARAAVIAIQSLAYVTPVFFLLLPRLYQRDNHNDSVECDIGCEGAIISVAVRLGILLIASYVLFWKAPRIRYPQINLYKSGVNALTFIITAVYWIFYSYKVMHWNQWNYAPIVQYTSQYVNVLIFLHYFAIVLIHFKSKDDIYLLEVVRTSDGAHRFYNIGDCSIQGAAGYILEQYYLDFALYDPALRKVHKPRVKPMANFKNYDIDGPNDGASIAEKNRAILAAAARRRDAGTNERYYDEVEHERKVRKRLARLTEAAEDSFAHIKRQLKCDSNMPGASQDATLDPIGTAQAIFPAMARSIQKYLRTTRQHQHYQMEDIIDHLAFCIRHDMSASAFLQRYTKPRPSSSYPGKLVESVDWSVNCDEPLITHLRPGIVFSLNQLDYSLVVTCRTAPKIELREEFIDPASHRFAIRMDGSETSV